MGVNRQLFKSFRIKQGQKKREHPPEGGKRAKCSRCLQPITKSGLLYPHLCRSCEDLLMEGRGRMFERLDNLRGKKGT